MATKKTLEYDLVNDKAEYETLPMKAGDTGEYVKLADKDSSGGASTNAPSGIVGTKTNTGTTAAGNGTKTTSAQVAYPDVPEYQKYTYNKYAPSETVQQADAALKAIQAAQPGAYQSKWQSQVDSIINQILNREKFSYDFNEDALYKQYAEQYTRGGKLAMQDTMGQASAMTGGYGSSYASTAGNQAYQEYLSKLNEVIPELYGMALDRYQMEGQEMYNQYGLLSSQEQQDYARYMDSYNQWLAERDYATNRYDTERNFDYNKYNTDRAFDYGVYSDDRNFDYNDYRNTIEDAKWTEAQEYQQWLDKLGIDYQDHTEAIRNEQWGAEFEASEDQRTKDNDYRERVYASDEDQRTKDNDYRERVYASDEDQRSKDNEYRDKVFKADEEQRGIENVIANEELGIKKEEHAMNKEAWEIEKGQIKDSEKLHSGKGYNNGTLTVGQLKDLQAVLGVDTDGLYGPKTKEAAGGLTADEAYAKYVLGTSDEVAEAYSSTTSKLSEGKELSASDIKGISTQVSDLVANEDLEGAEAYLTLLYDNGYISEAQLMSFLAPYVEVEESETVDTSVPTTSTVPGLGTSNNSSGSKTAPSNIGLDTIQKNAMDKTDEYMKKILGIK